MRIRMRSARMGSDATGAIDFSNAAEIDSGSMHSLRPLFERERLAINSSPLGAPIGKQQFQRFKSFADVRLYRT